MYVLVWKTDFPKKKEQEISVVIINAKTTYYLHNKPYSIQCGKLIIRINLHSTSLSDLIFGFGPFLL